MPKLSAQDLSALELDAAYRALLDELQQFKAQLLELSAYDAKTSTQALVARAERIGRIKQIDDVLTWVARQRKKTT